MKGNNDNTGGVLLGLKKVEKEQCVAVGSTTRGCGHGW
jgi:hypothetical protein